MKRSIISTMFLVFIILASSSVFAGGTGKGSLGENFGRRWRNEYHHCSIQLMQAGLQERSESEIAKVLADFIRLEVQLGSVARESDSRYGHALVSQSVSLAPMEVLFEYLKNKGVHLSPDVYFSHAGY